MTNFWNLIFKGIPFKEALIESEALDAHANVPTDKIETTYGKCVACSYYPLQKNEIVEVVELANGLCVWHWDDCVDLMAHYSMVDPSGKIWISLQGKV
mgnify:CR=1 FL=1